MSESPDPALAALLAALLHAHEDAGRLPVAQLRQRLGLPQRLVMRSLSTLIDAKLVELTRLHDQNIAATLTDAGLGLARRHQDLRIEALRKTVP
ncbi:hypothetical protein [Variovorax sp. JS1663]|uniref:hypothetical protein n=1 Tax=Variovorax sp. JS1663 TaxID=1851577 RepID=UPI00117F7417|nr:hypothetical protein [Variovorax sp. JS1663]